MASDLNTRRHSLGSGAVAYNPDAKIIHFGNAHEVVVVAANTVVALELQPKSVGAAETSAIQE